MFEIGNSLREARERQGLGYPEIELATKIRAKYIHALEDEQFEMLPAHTYVKGFLRTYAEYLGLDGQLYVDDQANERMRGAAQGFIAFILWGVGNFVGTMLAGVVKGHNKLAQPLGTIAYEMAVFANRAGRVLTPQLIDELKKADRNPGPPPEDVEAGMPEWP